MALVGARVCCLLVVLAAISQRVALGAPEDYEGKPVAGIEFEPALQPLPDDELADLIPVKPGAPLSLTELRRAIVRLYGTGRYRDVAADAQLADGTVRIRFITDNAWFVGGVAVEGVPEPPNKGELVNATGLRLGEQFTEEQIPIAISQLQEALRRNGFHEAKIERFLDYEAVFSQVNVLFLVEPGPRAKLSPPVIAGAPADEAMRLIKTTNWDRFWVLPGYKDATERRIQRGLERIRRYYQRRDFLLNSVSLEEIHYDPANQTVTPSIRVERRPRVRVETKGRNVSQGRLRKLIPIYQEQSVDRDLLIEGARNLTQHLQSQGYFGAEVSFETNQSEDGALIEYTIEAGEKLKLTELIITGNEYFDEATLRERIATTPATRIRYRRGRFSQAMLENDIGSIRSLYRANGFRDVQVTPRVEIDEGNEGGEVRISIEIEEGEQWRVSSLELNGVSDINREYVESLINSIPGQPYSETKVATDRDNILAFYYNNGYLSAQFDWEASPDLTNQTVALRMAITEGPRRFVRAPLVGGLDDTQPSLVYSRILLEPGDPLSQSQMVETQRRLYDLGIFARVEQAIQNPDGNTRAKYLLHQFEEARRYSVNFGIGAQIGILGGGTVTDFDNPAGSAGFSPRVSVGVSRANMFGAGHTAGFQTSVSDIRQRALVNYLAPQFKGNENFAITVSGLYDFSRDINTFESERWEGTFQFRQRLSRANSFRYRFTYRRVATDNIRISPELIPVFAQPVRVGLFAVDFIQDRRDDPLDSTRGFYNAIEAGLASSYLGSETEYLRLIGRNSSYHRVGREIVLARSLTVGWLGNAAADPDGAPIPLPERIFSGGASSHRGFPDNQAGPRDLETGFPLGGGALLIHNLELRFPLLGETVGGVLFHDAGNVYSSFDDISFRYRQRDNQDFDYMVHSFGFGVRYRTPIGPIRLDLGFSPNSPRFFGFEGTLDELIQGGGRKVDQRINRFQFFFSIGQTF